MRKMNAFPVLFASWQLNCSGHESFDCDGDRDSDSDGDSDGKSALSRCKFCFSFNFNSTFRIRRE